jgi:subtilisin family serine protease
MRRPLASVVLSLLLTVALVVPTIAADPSPSAGASGEPAATPSADPTPAPTGEPAASASTNPTATPNPNPTAPATTVSPDPSASPNPSVVPTASAQPEPVPPASAETDPAPSATVANNPAPPSADATTDTEGRPIAAGRYIVILSATADTAGVIARHRDREGIKADRRFERAVRAFSAKLDAGQRRALLADPNVVAVVPDEVIGLAGQVNPTGVSRVGARLSPVAKIDGIDERVDADVAIVDTGVVKHADLNVVGGVNCSTSDRSAWQDQNGHGTHVAGTVAAIDNDFGVVGVAPGARIWAVRILNADGYGLLSWYVCGLDWILAQRDPTDSTRPLIEAVNMSVAKSGSDDRNCGLTNKDILHQAICRLYKGGITVVAAAANESRSAANFVPAAYNEVITVSALADTDGKAGGLGGNRCYSWGTYDVDDTFADFSNYGSDIDIIAPGKCIWSTVPGGYRYSSGTSMAAPAVTGAVALYKASRPGATPSEVRASLRYLGNNGWKTSTDPDSVHEPLLDVHRLGNLGSFGVGAETAVLRIPSAGGAVTTPVTVTRSSTFFERVSLSFTDVPIGWSATTFEASLFGWTGTATTATITAPSTATPGRYQIKVVGSNWGRERSAVITIDVAGDLPEAKPPRATIATRVSTGLVTNSTPSIALRVSWPAATDASDLITRYQVQHSINGGAWTTVSTGASTLAVVFSGLPARTTHQFRVRAQDSDGDWSAWAETETPYGISSIGDRSSLLTYRGTWKRTTSASAIGDTLSTARTRGATVTHQFTGRGVAIVAPTTPTRGKANIFIDGVFRKTIDLRTSTVHHRRVVYAFDFGVSGPHTIVLAVLGTSGRPAVSIDAVVILR